MENNDKIDVIDFTHLEERESEFDEKVEREKISFPPLPVAKEIIPEKKEEKKIEKEIKEVKKQNIEEFNDSPRTKEYGVKLISKKTLVFLYIVIGTLILGLIANMVWHNIILKDFSDKDFSPTINNEITPNISAEFTEGTDNVYVYNNYTTINNITLVNNITLPNNLTIKVENLSI
jgi:uncharacterized protein YktA (UPF0223 family)